MKKKTTPQLFRLRFIEGQRYWCWDDKHNSFIPLDERFLTHAKPGFGRLNEKEREKERRDFLRQSEIIAKACLPYYCPNAKKKIHSTDRTAHYPSAADIKMGSQAALSVTGLFAEARTGYVLLANLLCGLRCAVLCRAEPGFRPAIAISRIAPELVEIFIALVQAAVTRKRWKGKNCVVKRIPVLNYSSAPGEFPRHFQDFSNIKARIAGDSTLLIPAEYTDTVALILGAEGGQLREAAPYFKNAAVFLLGCGTNDWGATKLPSAAVARYDPEILDSLVRERERIAAALHRWWAVDDEDIWAKRIVQEARASFGKADSKYISVILDPNRLREAIWYRVLLSFLDELENDRLLSAEELQPYREGAKEAFDPEPKAELPVRRMEEPAVFLELMQGVVAQGAAKIAALGQPFRKADKLWGAWRQISGSEHLVMLEKDWSRIYAKAARAAEGVDTALLQQSKWELELQKQLMRAGAIKEPSAGYRYRYDLFGNHTRNTTYVVAIPRGLLEAP